MYQQEGKDTTEKKHRLRLRSWSEFFDLNRIGVPDVRELEERMATNLLYYQGNYLAMFGAVYVLNWFFSILLVVVTFFIVGFGLLLFEVRDQKASFAEQAAYTGVSFAAVLYCGGFTLVQSVLVCFLLVVLHSVFRRRSLKSRAFTWRDAANGYSPLAAAAKWAETRMLQPSAAPTRRRSHPGRTQEYEDIRSKYVLRKR